MHFFHIFLLEQTNPVLMAFSVFTNGRALFSCKPTTSKNIVTCFDGIRVLAACFIIVGHVNNYFRSINLNPNEFEKVFILNQHLSDNILL